MGARYNDRKNGEAQQQGSSRERLEFIETLTAVHRLIDAQSVCLE
jgi:hypothetical protein